MLKLSGLAVRKPAPWISLKRIIVHCVRKALESTSAQIRIAAVLAPLASPSSVSQPTEKIALAVECLQRDLEKISHTNGHPAARVHVTVRHHRNERITSRAAIRVASGKQELQSTMHGDLGAVEPPLFCVGSGLVHDFEEFACFRRSQDFIGQTRSPSIGNESVCPHPSNPETSPQFSYLAKLPKIGTVGGK